MEHTESQESYILPLRRALVERPLEGKWARRNELFRYKRFGYHDGFTEVHSRTAPHHYVLRNDGFRGFDENGFPILANISEYRQKDEFTEKKLEDYLSKPEKEYEVKIGNCLCKSNWCPKCHKLFYIPKYKDRIRLFDYKKTRHVILTTDRSQFSDNIEALDLITKGKALSAFLRKLEMGKKVKVGKEWVWEHLPIIISKVLAVLEFYEDGFPHWHLLIEVEGEGKAGMIGGSTLHWAWKYGIVKETFFRNENHWKNIAGYFADKGYFEKGKEYQTVLPENIKEGLHRRIRRITFYNHVRDSDKTVVYEEEHLDVTEKEAFEECSAYFTDKKREQEKKPTFVGYKAVLSKCGSKTFIRASVKGIIFMILPVSFQVMKEFVKPEYLPDQGYVCNMSFETIMFLRETSEKVMEKQDYSYDGFIKEEDWAESIEDLECEAKRVITQGELF